ncbi:hypothetical protein [Pelagibacterium mangrovi]|uniref:hypothetical protein n=1 Tax=Pelagibacterium mangrovi TaxID=3119828 RepID=UPI002FCB886F
MKFDHLARQKRATKEQLRAKFVREEREVYPDAIVKRGLTPGDIAHVHCVNARPLIETGFVDQAMGVVRRFAVPATVNGWSVVPQESDGERKPSFIIDPGKSTTAKPRAGGTQFLPTDYRAKRMSLSTAVQIGYGTPGANLAIQCCAASAHIRVLDIDCRDPEIAEAVKTLALEVLGDTPFIRYGARPKVALIYRQEAGSDDERWSIPKWSVEMLGADGKRDIDDELKPINSVEFLSEGGLLTAYGLHHKTGKSFDWSEGRLHPAIASPLEAPVINKAQVRQFLNRLCDIRALSGGVSTSNPHGGAIDVSELRQRFGMGQKIWVPRLQRGPFSLNEKGDVTDGGEAWLTQFVWALCAANAQLIDRYSELLVEAAIAEAIEKLGQTPRDNEGLMTHGGIEQTTRFKMRSPLEKWRASLAEYAKSGRYHDICVPWHVTEDGRRPQSKRVMPAPRPADGSLDWIPDDYCIVDGLSDHAARAKVLPVEKTAEQIAADKADRAIIEDLDQRHAIADGISDKVDSAIRDFLDADDAPLVLLRAPTGSGKTSRVVRSLGPWIGENPKQDGEGPILAVVPTHANADEALKKATTEGMMTPEDYWTDGEVNDAIGMLGGTGIKATRFRGRDAAGCLRKDEMRMLGERGIGASNLCGKKVDDEDAIVAAKMRKEGQRVPQKEILCPFRESGECGYYKQFQDIRDADIVFVSHAYLTMHSLPKALKNPRRVIVDESVVFQIIDQARMPLDALELPRVEPYVTKLDRKKFPEASDEDIKSALFGDRLEACSIAKDALIEGKDVATVFRELERGSELVDAAITVLARSKQSERKVDPRMNVDDVKELAAQPQMSDLITEERFWRIVRDRLNGLEDGSATGNRDMRIQLVQIAEMSEALPRPFVRISWRKDANWSAAPTLLLDASGDAAITEKLFGRAPTVINIEAPMHVRVVAAIESTYSTSQFVPRDPDDSILADRCAGNVNRIRDLITSTSVVYGYGRVLAGATMSAREAIQSGWGKPASVDFGHFGALRGLDFAKNHAAAISIGRSEQPIHIVDGYAAALTYDDPDPELPYDQRGDGMTDGEKALLRQAAARTIRMRTGEDIQHFVPQFPTKKDGSMSWAQRLEEQWREEEIRQFLGRLRPVYRGIAHNADGEPIDVETPVLIAVGKCLPDVIVDEIVTLDQLLAPAKFLELVRLSGGILSDTVTPYAPGAQEILQGRSLQQFKKDCFPHSDAWVKRLMDGMGRIVYRMPGETTHRQALVATAWIDGDPVAQFENDTERWGAMLPEEIISYKPSKRQPVGFGEARQPDKLDLKLAAGEPDEPVAPAISTLSDADLISMIPMDIDEREPVTYSKSNSRSTRIIPPFSQGAA